MARTLMAERIIEMGSRFKQFIVSLQVANERTKQRWIIGASAASIVVVVLLWLVYLTLTLPSLPSMEPDVRTSTVAEETAAPSESTFFSTFTKGFGILLKQTEAGLASFAGKIAESVATVKKGIQKKNVIEVQGTASPQSAIPPAPTSTESTTTISAATSTPQ